MPVAARPAQDENHHLSLTGAPSKTSAIRARVPAVVSPGSSSSAKNLDAAISRLGAGGALWRNA
jgi:hypothetical protein